MPETDIAREIYTKQRDSQTVRHTLRVRERGKKQQNRKTHTGEQLREIWINDT